MIEYEQGVEQGRNEKCIDKIEVIVFERVKYGRNGTTKSLTENTKFMKKWLASANSYIQQKRKGYEQRTQCIGQLIMLATVEWQVKYLF